MLDAAPDNIALTLILADSESTVQTIKAAGFKSVRLATCEESVCRIVDGKAVVDPAITDFFATVIVCVADPE